MTQSKAPAPPSAHDDALTQAALAAQAKAYAPYSKFYVGAVVVAVDGSTYSGANIENASYGLCVCAERNAVAAAVMAGATQLQACTVATHASPPSAPCGMCRQVLLEFAAAPASFAVVAVNPAGERRQWQLADLIVDGFSGKELPTHAQ